MAISDLTELQILEGTFSIIWVIISAIVGIRIIIKSMKLNRKELIFVGLFWIFLAAPWCPSAITFLTYIFFNAILDERTYLLIANIPIAPGLFCWIYSYCNIIYKDQYTRMKPALLLIYALICTIYEILLIYFLFTNMEMIGTVEGLFNSRYNYLALVFDIFALISILITGVIFSVKSIKVDDPEIQWKGRFLLIAFISFIVGAFFDVAVPNIGITIVIGRLFLITSAIEYYLGFFLPERLAKFLIKNR